MDTDEILINNSRYEIKTNLESDKITLHTDNSNFRGRTGSSTHFEPLRATQRLLYILN